MPERIASAIVAVTDGSIEPATAKTAVLDGEEIGTARRYADASRAASTQRAYASDWRRFCAWCVARSLDTLPADPRVVAVFLAAEADAGSAPLTVGRRLAAIGWMHRRAGLQPPQARENAAAILEVIAGIRRSHGIAPAKKHAADADVLRDILRAIPATTCDRRATARCWSSGWPARSGDPNWWRCAWPTSNGCPKACA